MNHCAECGRPVRRGHSRKDEVPGTLRMIGRGLCCACYRRAQREGTLDDYERTFRPREEMLEDWELLRSDGYTVANAAPRMGMTCAALEKALRRAERDGDPRAGRRAA